MYVGICTHVCRQAGGPLPTYTYICRYIYICMPARREGLYVQFDSYEDQEMLITNEVSQLVGW